MSASSSQLTRRESERDAGFRTLVEQLDALAESARRLATACRGELVDDAAPTLDRTSSPRKQIVIPLPDWIVAHHRLVLGAIVALAIAVAIAR